MRILVYVVLMAITGCANAPGKYADGAVLEARNLTRYPQYNGTRVIVRGYGWRWVKQLQGNAMKVYEIETIDGDRLAAQEFQLKPL